MSVVFRPRLRISAAAVVLFMGPKRKRRGGSSCANPLFVKWVEELRDDAKRRELGCHYSYTKALNSIKKYPLPLKSGEEAKILDYVGEKLAKLLDKKLAEYNPESDSGGTDSGGDSGGQACSSGLPPAMSQDRHSSSPSQQPPSKRRKTSKKADKTTPSKGGSTPGAREYVPTFRSGPYALIVALYKAKEKPSWEGFLLKEQLMAEAQPHCDASFTIPPDSKSHYTAWSSMSKIVGKGLVQRRGCPAKFSLTVVGETLARRLLQESSALATPTSAASSSADSQPCVAPPRPGSTPKGKGSARGRNIRKGTRRPAPTPPPPPAPPRDSTPISLSSSPDAIPPAHKITYVESPPVSIPSDFSELESRSCSRSRSNSSSGRRSDHAFSPPLLLPRNGADSVQSPGDHTPSPLPPISVGGDSPPTLKFWYVNHEGKSVLNKDSAAVTFNDIVTVGFLVKCKMADLESSPAVYTLDESREGEGVYVYAYLGNLDAPDRACPPDEEDHMIRSHTLSGPSSAISPPANPTSSPPPFEASGDSAATVAYDLSPSPCLITVSDSEEDMQPLSSRLMKTAAPSASHKHSAASTGTATRCEGRKEDGREASMERGGGGGGGEGSLTPAQAAGRAALNRLRNTTTTTTSTSTRPSSSSASLPAPCPPNSANSGPPKPSTSGPPEARSSSRPLKSASSGIGGREECRGREMMESKVDLPEPEFELEPGEFEVVLLVDSSESTASRKSSSQFRGILLQELGKNGVLYDVRKLNVGDFTWIAREKSRPRPGCLSLPRSREVVLDYIVERKRMDDLAGSIIDGRFNEQKFRLKNCGVAHPVYLVEEYGDSAHCKIDLKALNQAVANTQVIDKFFVKRTKDIRESVAYLTIFTRSLQLAYSGKRVRAYCWETVTDLSKERSHDPSCTDLTSSVVHGIEFTKFNEASIKNKPLTVQEMFGRHLMQLPGLSADKAAVILDKYPTLQHLMKGVYSSSRSESEKVKAIEDLRCGRTQRRLGPSLSKLLRSVYNEAN